MDDVHRSSILHPGPVVIPAALAAAFAPLDGRATQVTGAQWLSALVVGYEAMIRVARCLGPVHYRHWHTTSTAGSFGAAAAAAAVWNLDESQSAQAMALAGTRAGGLWQVRHESSLAKSWHMAGAARDGVTAAQLAACGLTGPLAVLEGPSGWLAATAVGVGVGAIPIDEAQDRPWLVDVSFKPWPACRHAHPAMDALQEALASAPGPGWTAADIRHIDVHTYADALRFCDRPQPTDSAQARFSIQHAIAAWCLWGPAQLSHYEGAALTDTAVRALRGRVRLHVDATIESRYPQHYGARLVLHRHDGAQHTVALQDTLGDPAKPLSLAALQDKACMLMAAGGWAPPRIDAALAACAGLPQAPDLSALQRVVMS
jgi:2-methylcitrate dehydratase PrpD